MNEKRILLFLGGCIPTRLLFVLISKYIPLEYLPVLGYAAFIIATGFMYIFISGSRKTGPETFGQKIWWNALRPVHALLYFLFSYYAMRKNRNGWIYLLYDVILGLVSFLLFHFR